MGNFSEKLAKFDFAKGWKTLAGLLILFAPHINDNFGTNITPDLLEALKSELTTMFWIGITTFGVLMKIIRK